MRNMIQVVCIGGGTGQSGLLAALRQNPALSITAIVSMFDSGGSSGVLRDRFGVLPPSDLQRCMAALSPYPYVREILNERIAIGTEPYHTGGNLLMATLEREYGRQNAVQALANMFRIQGQVLPVSWDSGNLWGKFSDGTEADAEVAVDEGVKSGKTVERLEIRPNTHASTEALQAISRADVIIIGPGSLYTSILPNLLVPGMRDVINDSAANIMWIMNLMAEGAQFSDGARVDGVCQHWKELFNLRSLPTKIIVNNVLPDATTAASFAAEQKYPITIPVPSHHPRIVQAALWKDFSLARHDTEELARVLSIVIPRLLDE